MKQAGLLHIALLPALAACTHSLHQVQVSDFQPYAPIESGNIVKGYAEQFTVLGFIQETNYVNDAIRQLSTACPDGAITGITTQISTSHGFLSWKNKALVQGLCLKRTARSQPDEAGIRNRPNERKRRPADKDST